MKKNFRLTRNDVIKKAYDECLTEMYAKRYDVEKEEASQMFILRDTPAAESAD